MCLPDNSSPSNTEAKMKRYFEDCPIQSKKTNLNFKKKIKLGL